MQWVALDGAPLRFMPVSCVSHHSETGRDMYCLEEQVQALESPNKPRIQYMLDVGKDDLHLSILAFGSCMKPSISLVQLGFKVSEPHYIDFYLLQPMGRLPTDVPGLGCFGKASVSGSSLASLRKGRSFLEHLTLQITSAGVVLFLGVFHVLKGC